MRGLATTARTWLDTTDTWVETHAQFDRCGSPRKSWDALGRVSEVEYSAAYHFAYPTLTRSPVPDPSGQHGSTTALVTETAYDFSTGRVTWQEDANDQVTTFSYADDQGVPDPLGRLRKVTASDGGWTKYSYNQTPYGDNINTQSLQNSSGVVEVGYQFFDGLGRPARSFVYENREPAKQWLTTDTEYDAVGRVKRTSLPYRSTGAATPPFSTDKWTETAYDALGRVLTVTTQPNNAAVKTDYSGDRVLVTDQAGKQRVSRTDALGRLAEVWEVRSSDPPSGTEAVAFPSRPGVPAVAAGYRTAYAYDVLGNLRKVAQGTQARFFAYDSLGRLVRAKSPEQGSFTPDPAGGGFPALTDATSGTANSDWSVGYQYDAAGNLTKRKDARNVTATYAYDNLSRNTAVTYHVAQPVWHIADTPGVTRYYDGAIRGQGPPVEE